METRGSLLVVQEKAPASAETGAFSLVPFEHRKGGGPFLS